jgi:hypothetical protein
MGIRGGHTINPPGAELRDARNGKIDWKGVVGIGNDSKDGDLKIVSEQFTGKADESGLDDMIRAELSGNSASCRIVNEGRASLLVVADKARTADFWIRNGIERIGRGDGNDTRDGGGSLRFRDLRQRRREILSRT